MRVIHLLRKPLSESSVATNVFKHGCGAIHVDACRLATPEDTTRPSYGTALGLMNDDSWKAHSLTETGGHDGGRWPANLVLEHLPGCRRTGTRKVKAIRGGTDNHHGMVYGKRSNIGAPVRDYADEDGLESVAAWECQPGCPVRELNESQGSEGAPSRFFKQVGGDQDG